MSLTPRLDKVDKNYIINGNFDFWQRGTSSSPSGNTFLADRWQNNSGVTSYSRQSGGPNDVSSFFARVSGSSGLIGLSQRIESIFAKMIKNSNLTFSFWIKTTSGTPAFSVRVREPGAADNYTSNTLTQTIPVGNASTSWTKYTVTVPVSVNMVQRGFQIEVSETVAGSTTFDLAQMILLDGEVQDPEFSLAGSDYAAELALCQRYYEKSYDLSVNPGTNTVVGREAFVAATTFHRHSATYKCTKRATPTVNVWSATGVADTANRDAGATAALGSISSGVKGFSAQGAGFTTAVEYSFQWASDAEMV